MFKTERDNQEVLKIRTCLCKAVTMLFCYMVCITSFMSCASSPHRAGSSGVLYDSAEQLGYLKGVLANYDTQMRECAEEARTIAEQGAAAADDVDRILEELDRLEELVRRVFTAYNSLRSSVEELQTDNISADNNHISSGNDSSTTPGSTNH